MAKKFIDEQGLTTIWGQINDKFIRKNYNASDGTSNSITSSDNGIWLESGNTSLNVNKNGVSVSVGDNTFVDITKDEVLINDEKVATESFVNNEVSEIQNAFVNGGVKNPYALTFKNGYGNTNNVVYDGSEAKEINLDPHTLGTVERLKRITNDDDSNTITVLENSGSSFIIKTTNSSGPTETTLMVDKDGAYINNVDIATEDWVDEHYPRLDSNNLIPASYLPSYVDDVMEYSSKTAFPLTGETGKVYVALDTNIVYRWGGSTYVEISSSLALGETSSTAYAGDKGKENATNIAALQGYFSGGIAKQAAKVTNKINFNNSGTADDSGTNYDGSSAVAVSYNTIGAVPAKQENGNLFYSVENTKDYVQMGFVYVGTPKYLKISKDTGLTYSGNEIIDESMALTEAEIKAICV